jgi:hypothetical protein
MFRVLAGEVATFTNSVTVWILPLQFKGTDFQCWNVRGLNDSAKRASVRSLVMSSNATIVCLQETKALFSYENFSAKSITLNFAAHV